MNCVRSKILEIRGVAHGFGLGGFLLSDYLSELAVKNAVWFSTNQMHSNSVCVLTREAARAATEGRPYAHIGPCTDDRPYVRVDSCRGGALSPPKIEADAFITCAPGVICYVRTADCVPILMCDPVRRVVAAVHAGWRGTAKRVAVKTVEYFTRDFGSKRDDICVAIGPAIAGRCYEVDDDVAESLVTCAGEHLSRSERAGKWNVDLQQVNKKILTEAGVKNIDVIPVCNHCDPRFASYRRNKSEEGRQANFICLG